MRFKIFTKMSLFMMLKLLVLLSLSGCTYSSKNMFSETRTKSLEDNHASLVIFDHPIAIFDNDASLEFGMYFQKVDSDNGFDIRSKLALDSLKFYTIDHIEDDFEFKAVAGNSYIMKFIEPGEYFLSEILIFPKSQPSRAINIRDIKQKLTFSVVGGEVAYLGCVQLDARINKLKHYTSDSFLEVIDKEIDLRQFLLNSNEKSFLDKLHKKLLTKF